jgi:predicted transcriptional regulator
VEQSLRTGDFSGLSGVVTDTVNSVVDEAKRQVQQARNSSGAQSRNTYTARTTTYRTNDRTYTQQRHWSSTDSGKPQQQRVFQAPRAIFKRKGDISSVLFTVFGGIGTAFTALALLIFGIIALVLLRPVARIIGFVIIALLMGGSIAMIVKGASSRKRLARAERYLALCQNHDYINLSELAEQTGKSEDFVRRDVKNMLGAGMFPQGHLDRKESCLMLSDDTYREYLAIEKERTAYEMEQFADQQRRRMNGEVPKPDTGRAEAPAAAEESDAGERQIWRSLSGIEDAGDALKKENPKLAEMIAQGQECTGHIRQMNEQIPGEVISAKLDTLEHVLEEIFNRVREHPEQMPKMQKFMDYYLPTTLKLVEAYEEFDSVPNPNGEILQAKEELEKTLDTINASFEELLNQLYQPSVLDATTDAKVLQTVLAKDGLAKDHAFDKKE